MSYKRSEDPTIFKETVRWLKRTKRLKEFCYKNDVSLHMLYKHCVDDTLPVGKHFEYYVVKKACLMLDIDCKLFWEKFNG